MKKEIKINLKKVIALIIIVAILIITIIAMIVNFNQKGNDLEKNEQFSYNMC